MRKLKTREFVAVGIGITTTAVLLFGNNIWDSFFNKNKEITIPNVPILPASQPEKMNNISKIQGLEIYDEVLGTGTEAVSGKNISAHYIGILNDGTKFDSSVDRGVPFSFSLGMGQVIKGWDLGIEGMKIGGIRRLVISPELAYGESGITGPDGTVIIPPNATLIFQVQLLGVE